MESEHQNIIISNLSTLVNETDLPTLVPELLRREVFTQRMIDRILDPSHEPKRQKTDLYVEILRRGPRAFRKLQAALISANHTNLAAILSPDARDSAHFPRSDSLTSVGSNRSPYSSDNSENDGPAFSSCRKFSGENMHGATKRPDSLPLPTSTRLFPPGDQTSRTDFQPGDVREPRLRDPRHKVFNPPTYDVDYSEEWLTAFKKLTHEERKFYPFERDLPVCVEPATDWKFNPPGGPRLYKMDSNPRGCALILNNMRFENQIDLPNRTGAENDEKRFKALLEQLHFTVEVHRNKTKTEMLMIVEKFSQKPELKQVDCIWVTIMTHGGEGCTSDEGELVGVDGFGCKTSDIVSHFYNDACKAAINKPKIFFFQACRGSLTDPGVRIPGGKYVLSLDGRITYDGNAMNNKSRDLRVRTHSDVFIAYPTHEGIRANRDVISGTWFIQTVVNVFSELSKDCHLEDMLKVVDERIKSMNNLQTSNFQAVSTTSIGWHKHLYFNPGLYRDRSTGETMRFGKIPEASESGEGTDEVDASSASSDKSPNGIQQSTYARLKDDEGESSGNHSRRDSCCLLSFCRTS